MQKLWFDQKNIRMAVRRQSKMDYGDQEPYLNR